MSTSTRSSTRTASRFCTKSRKGRPTAAMACKSRSSPACPPTRSARHERVSRRSRLAQSSARREAHGDLFAPAGAVESPPHVVSSAALDRLAALDPDALSPREAQAALYELKRLAKN